jgi:hypothetical protein
VIWGKYSVAELADLLVAKDQEMKALEDAWRKYDAQWMSYDPAADNAWMADFNLLKNRYGAARVKASASVAAAESAHEDEKNIGADAEFKGVIASLKQDPTTVSKGDLQDLWDRLQNAMTTRALLTGQKPQIIPAPNVWQPAKGSDADVNVLKNLGGPGILGAVQGVGNILTMPAGGMTQPPAPPHKTSTTKLLAIGGALTLGVIAAVKIGWKFVKPF